MSDSGPRRLGGIDVLRGIAIFFVLMNHVGVRLAINKVRWRQSIPNQLITPLVGNGQHGVQIFFVISGFLITSLTLRRWGKPAGVRPGGFYLLRFARIAPLFLLLLAVLSVLHLSGAGPYVIQSTRASLGQALTAAFTFRVNVQEARHGYLPGSWDVLWSLSVEEVFYIVFPVACILLRRTWVLIVVLCFFVIAGPFARVSAYNEVWREYSYLGSMDAIALGCLTALFLSHYKLATRTLLFLRIAGSALMLFIMGAPVIVARLGIERAGLDMTILAFGAAMTVAAAAQTESPDWQVTAPLRWLGKRSYEVYLTHMFVVFGLLSIFLATGKPLAGVLVYFAGTVLLATLLGELVARGYSEPLNAWIRRVWQVVPGTCPPATNVVLNTDLS